MKIRTTGAIAVIVTLAAAACQQDADRQERDAGAGPTASQTRDSAGILITENARPVDGSRLGWQVGSEPTVSIGAFEGEEPYLLHSIRGAVRMPDGRIVVANGGAGDVRSFTAAGSHLVSWGGKGEGPGEFRNLSWVAPWPGDSVVTWDGIPGRLQFSDAGGNFGRSVNLPRTYPRPLAVRPDGTILTVRQRERERLTIVEIRGGDGGLRASVGTYLNGEWIPEMGVDGPEPVVPAFSQELVTANWGDLVVATWNKPYEIRVLQADGTLTRIVRREHTPVQPTEPDRAVFVVEQMAYLGTFVNAAGDRMPVSYREEHFRPSLESRPLAEHFPAFSTVLADEAGYLWVREYDLPREERPAPLWTVFDPEGRVLGFVETPAGLDILQIGEDFILGRVKDEFEVEYVQVWPLER
ncbi:MAG: hypothetical protein F4123_08315 [Gemmatimonadetes bacterium]|nr:hypothetical protein [Gemmatimonadota bacterium]MYB99692.1 hypothetical protein [Gemmatimonadota bacterium]MYI46360.1 hypothetical protein [Gemmatimonadota bacterium]